MVSTDVYAFAIAMTGLGGFVAIGAVGFVRLLQAAWFWWRPPPLVPELIEVDVDLSQHRSIVSLMREEGVAPHKELTWAIGPRARAMHQARYGRPPPKALLAKTSGQGSHDFAVYPPEMFDELRALVRDSVSGAPEKPPLSKAS